MFNSSLQSFFWLIFAHSVGDMGLQTCYIADNKRKKFNVMMAHCIIWAGCVGIALKYLHIYSSWKIGFLIIAHFLTDYWSCRKIDSTGNWQKWNTIDQLIHLIQLSGVFVL